MALILEGAVGPTHPRTLSQNLVDYASDHLGLSAMIYSK